ncbi:hypothetical protein K438DRAFT_1575579, partial [Mycena galopus ATCC 62051]
SIFVGDLAPETSNSDLVVVFRNPVLGLRNDRAPQFIRLFASCKSAKIMLDPVTGVSRGYGLVRCGCIVFRGRVRILSSSTRCTALTRPQCTSPPRRLNLSPAARPAPDVHLRAKRLPRAARLPQQRVAPHPRF